ncbi:MAG: 4-hydroxy-tetrahydrodipicolinate synthase [Bacteroidales bacterium]|nr:4-hydroxy-tetrahydrodipicolinate synthase [Bacteroidales bacterium]MBN2820120.1 4-hydroxy-tetrahydrodipicolinate synthase [Bacteroidales bacterium]
MSNTFEGTGVAIVTPFTKDLNVDFDSLDKTINHIISGGTDYIVSLGTTGETATLSKEEKIQVVEFTKQKVANRVPIVLGAGGNNTMEVVYTLKESNLNGISGILSVAPYYNKPSQDGLFEHFKAIANATVLPVILYNVPGRTSSNIAAKTVLKLAEECSNIIAIKEASGNFAQIMKIIKNKPEYFSVLSGDDALTLPMISLGAKGAISVVANSHPREFSQLIKAALKGDFTEANKFQYKLIDYIAALFKEGSPTGIKAALEIMGMCEKYVRLPLVPASDELYVTLQKLLTEI